MSSVSKGNECSQISAQLSIKAGHRTLQGDTEMILNEFRI